ncbi:unnamed protein product [Ambrosiozyma monospora]|uniref:Unnamed protein product n=1 Tax=Ambrosiozyma monospora TaxID=43982 RepID=A0ACB5UA53_AMBMO|nr:unnamed protein product [Ambrosiozyma monospora]
MIFNTDTFKSTKPINDNGGVSSGSSMSSSTNIGDRSTDNDSSDNSNSIQQLTPNEDFWVPVCLPKFNPNGFLYSFIQFIDLKDETLMSLYDLNKDILDPSIQNSSNPDSSKITYQIE